MMTQPTDPLPPPDQVIPLYSGVAPGSEAWTYEERTVFDPGYRLEFIQNIVRPTLLYYAPDPAKANGTAVIIAPGGGGVNLTIRYEGTRVAQQLNRAGVAAFVLKYRLVAHPPGDLQSKAYPHDPHGVVLAGPQQGQNLHALALADAQAAVRWVRAHAQDYGCSPQRIGFVGFSAGGALACRLVAGAPETRPDFFAPIYGVVKDHPVPTADAPPVFLAAAADDHGDVEAALSLFKAWRAARRPAELHLFQMGGHAFLRKGGGGDHVIDRLEEWLRTNGWLTPTASA